ncbi:MAG: FAD-dependent oxidoreductase, partial [Gemmatimonadetes bacterium]|nr:FAD-dependent oxidoreductase [Gemmatimonadota bacterium]
VYGADAPELTALAMEVPGGDERIHPRLPARWAEVTWAVRFEMARTVEDVLSRRTRSLLLDAAASVEVAEAVARRMADELGRTDDWVAAQVEEYGQLAAGYLPGGAAG